MREARGNLWDFYKQPNAVVCITTNGFVKQNGECVMGRGCAREASIKFPGLAKRLGDMIKTVGNVLHTFNDERLITFPVKHVWWKPADFELIKQSAEALATEASEHPAMIFYLPRPGCGNGGRNWETEVKPILESVGLPDNVVVVSR